MNTGATSASPLNTLSHLSCYAAGMACTTALDLDEFRFLGPFVQLLKMWNNINMNINTSNYIIQWVRPKSNSPTSVELEAVGRRLKSLVDSTVICSFNFCTKQSHKAALALRDSHGQAKASQTEACRSSCLDDPDSSTITN